MTIITIHLDGQYDLTNIPMLSEARMPSRTQPRLIVDSNEVWEQIHRQRKLISQLQHSNELLIKALENPIIGEV